MLATNETDDVLASPSTNADPLAFLDPYPDAEAEKEPSDEEDGERRSRAPSDRPRSFSWDSSEDSEMMGGSVEKTRGDERQGRVYICALGGGHAVVARTVRVWEGR